RVTWDRETIKLTPREVKDALESGTPSIVAGARGEALGIGVVLLRPEQVDIVAGRVREILERSNVG
ncbi:MAG TPA: hypothetical protein VI583_06775, partial [Cyclobacteriaceae bacterium]|nr:hypothetical protein [Cyclobacteriaceae bacterium]